MPRPKKLRPLNKKLDHLQRSCGKRREKPIILILCEGAATEPTYFQSLIDQWRLGGVRVRQARGSAPVTIVNDAAEAKKDRIKEAARSNVVVPFDEVWCVFDVDEHPNIQVALSTAHANGIEVALTNPSFEYWLVLHFERCASAETRHEMVRRLKKHISAFEKGGDHSRLLLPRVNDAVRHAEDIWRSQWRKPAAPNAALAHNPSTCVHCLVKKLRPDD